MKKILLYGGSFNPPHLGHVHMAETATEQLRPDELLIMPAGIPPHKHMAENTPAAYHRLKMAELAFGRIPGVRVSDWEINRHEKNYTVDTVEEICRRDPDARVTLLMGTDMFFTVKNWYRGGDLLRKCDLAVLPRCRRDDRDRILSFGEELKQQYGTEVVSLLAEPVEISSTRIRSEKREILSMVPSGVRQYIEENGLYGYENQ